MMNIKKLIAILMLVAGAFFSYKGIDTVTDSHADIEVLGLELEAENKTGKEKGYMFIGLGIVMLGGGIFSFNRGA